MKNDILLFEKFVARHGEVGAQAVIENLERFENKRAHRLLSLEERWCRLMSGAELYQAA